MIVRILLSSSWLSFILNTCLFLYQVQDHFIGNPLLSSLSDSKLQSKQIKNRLKQLLNSAAVIVVFGCYLIAMKIS